MMENWRSYGFVLAFFAVQFIVIPLWGRFQSHRKAAGRRLSFESRGWKWVEEPEKEAIYFVQGEMSDGQWSLEARKIPDSTKYETEWSAPLKWELETGISAPSLRHTLVGNPLAFSALRWFMRREIKKEAGVQSEDEERVQEEMLKVTQAMLRSRPLQLEALRDFCIFNSVWREDAVREVFNSQIERDLSLFLQKLGGASRKTFVCRLGKTQISLRVSEDLPAPLAIEMAELGIQIAARARRFCGQETGLLNDAPIHRALRRLPAAQREELLGQTPQEWRNMVQDSGDT